jgi:hypothetical protein
VVEVILLTKRRHPKSEIIFWDKKNFDNPAIFSGGCTRAATLNDIVTKNTPIFEKSIVKTRQFLVKTCQFLKYGKTDRKLFQRLLTVDFKYLKKSSQHIFASLLY